MIIVAHPALRTAMIAAGALALSALRTSDAHEASSAGHETVTPVMQQALANASGKTLSAVVVTYAPGQASPAHRHAGSVFAYVLSGEIRSQNSATGAARVYKAGESFFEPPGSEHLISENASRTEPARLLAVFVADDGAVLTTPSK
ncbi:Cupin 2 conserved barrel domain protein [Methylobacterium sp. 4-46]|uniref:cupin domain-containing protein n=1 Tax=unclassified Methylobacterium TaxID=2615210 RepID=UPI000165CBA1|nr:MULTISPECIES: cupin domain-containing protein [Methylobacterium]ACA19926.1 Cupin 2 conserved barrel domain protein [Methylobacterium sp. 4-46]WFT79109.1 cupin domain-containing protein [Methylobacterium nodulans]